MKIARFDPDTKNDETYKNKKQKMTSRTTGYNQTLIYTDDSDYAGNS